MHRIIILCKAKESGKSDNDSSHEEDKATDSKEARAIVITFNIQRIG